MLFNFLDSEIGYDKVMSEIAKSYGSEYTLEIKLKILGTPEHDTARIAVREMGLPLAPEKFLEIYKSKVCVELQNPPLLPGVIGNNGNIYNMYYKLFCRCRTISTALAQAQHTDSSCYVILTRFR